MRSIHLSFTVNGEEREILAKPGTRLLDALRDALGMTGTRDGCSQGGCGACTVLVDGRSVLSCLLPAELAEGAQVETIEGLAGDGTLHPLQQAFIERLATQCGFCTSGMVMAAEALLRRDPDPSREAVIEALSGNVCRCTGYDPIVEAVLDAAARQRGAARQVA